LGIRRCRKKIPCPSCLNYHIKQCAAPCLAEMTREKYAEIVRNVAVFLKGKRIQLIRSLTNEMERLANIQEYETAARIRDQINVLEELSAKQRVDMSGRKEQDIIAYAVSNSTGSVQIFHVSEGKLIGRDTLTLKSEGSDENEVLSSIIKQYYQDVVPPEEIIVPSSPDDISMTLWLSEKGSRLKTPRTATEKGLLNLAQENAGMLLHQKMLAEGKDKDEAVQELQKALSLPVMPSIIEAFDISNISGTDATGSLAVFENGKPDKKNYRRFRIKTVKGADDFAMMKEVVGRTYRRRRDERKRMPDLVLMDGGKGQLNAAISAISDLGLKLNTAALAKEFEYIFLPERDLPVILQKGTPARLLLQRIRDEAHRFALGYHRKLREKRHIGSALDSISGIGEKKKMALLQYFGSVEKLKDAGLEEIRKVKSLTIRDAERVHGYFHEHEKLVK
ncbi:MAG: excinuclease ABC subunit UvrC, partial [Candidatus Methanoperedens sp.]|nr:excinuclease ABC subunit UvrC [Candidatus Methanoperedens sp.]